MDEEITTKEEFQARMGRLFTLINRANARIEDAPGLSTEQNNALAERTKLITDFVNTQIAGQKKFGSYGLVRGKPGLVYTVPKETTELASALNNPQTALQAATLAAPFIERINMGTVGQLQNPNHYRLPVDSKSVAAAVKVGNRGAGVMGPPTASDNTGATGPTGSTGPTGTGGGRDRTGGGVAVGTTKVTNGKTSTWNGKKWVTDKKPKVNWEPKFREMFPQKAWLLDLDRTKYADVFKVIEEGVINKSWLTPEASKRFLGQLDNTSFIKELASSDMVRQVKGLVGDLGFGEGFNSFLTKAMNFGWKDETLKQEVYKEAFRKDDAGAFVNQTALARVRASNDYLTVKKIGTDYFSNIDEDTIQKSLTGGINMEDIERQQRELAKAKYGHLSNLLDQGFTLDKLTSSFKQQAAQLLEKDINDIDMSQADYEQVINTGEPGQKRMLTTGEWEIKLRSDPRYNWGSTQNAKDEARRLSASIAQAFGKVI
jgi:hypothetical protein